MKDKLINPNFNGTTVEKYLRSLGVTIREKTEADTEDLVSVRGVGSADTIYYGFKELADATSFGKFLERHDISYGVPRPSIGSDGSSARYPYHIAIPMISPPKITTNRRITNTNYTPESLAKAIQLAHELKIISVYAQDYELASDAREIERYLIVKEENDKNRTI